MQPRRNIVVGIAGGTGSGKTTLAKAIQARLEPYHPLLLHQDSYYKDTPARTDEEKEQTNFDHPDAFDTALLVEHLTTLKAGQPIRQPVYDFTRHSRSGFIEVKPAKVILLEGILILAEPTLRCILDVPLFVDTPDDIRFMRRLRRDTEVRGRSLDSVYRQYLATVRPMHLQFVEPSKQFARLIVPEGGRNEMAVDVVTSYIQRAIDPHGSEPAR
ncbi:MAG TPA: uridine kinase [Armatimonadota bacterium]|jgi:uridine kinase